MRNRRTCAHYELYPETNRAELRKAGFGARAAGPRTPGLAKSTALSIATPLVAPLIGRGPCGPAPSPPPRSRRGGDSCRASECDEAEVMVAAPLLMPGVTSVSSEG